MLSLFCLHYYWNAYCDSNSKRGMNTFFFAFVIYDGLLLSSLYILDVIDGKWALLFVVVMMISRFWGHSNRAENLPKNFEKNYNLEWRRTHFFSLIVEKNVIHLILFFFINFFYIIKEQLYYLFSLCVLCSIFWESQNSFFHQKIKISLWYTDTK